jgi:hypothetical protein
VAPMTERLQVLSGIEVLPVMHLSDALRLLA